MGITLCLCYKVISTCVCPCLSCLCKTSRAHTIFWFGFPIVSIRVYVKGANLLSHCSLLCLGVCVSVRESLCVHECAQLHATNFPSHPVLLRRNHPWLVLQYPEKNKWRGQQAAGEHLSSSVQQMGYAGEGTAVWFTFSSKS